SQPEGRGGALLGGHEGLVLPFEARMLFDRETLEDESETADGKTEARRPEFRALTSEPALVRNVIGRRGGFRGHQTLAAVLGDGRHVGDPALGPMGASGIYREGPACPSEKCLQMLDYTGVISGWRAPAPETGDRPGGRTAARRDGWFRNHPNPWRWNALATRAPRPSSPSARRCRR